MAGGRRERERGVLSVLEERWSVDRIVFPNSVVLERVLDSMKTGWSLKLEGAEGQFGSARAWTR